MKKYRAIPPDARNRERDLFRSDDRTDTIAIRFSNPFETDSAEVDPTPLREFLEKIMILLIDNYDSFTYNLVQRLGEIDPGLDIQVVRNDRITLDEIADRNPARIIISPGPCTPREAGISNLVIERFAPTIPLLGVCLGHQCIGHTYGAVVERADRIMHGKTSMIHHDGKGVYQGLSNPFQATRYHSLVIRPGNLER